MATNSKKIFKLNVLGLCKLETEEWTVKQVAFIMAMVMVFFLILIIVLKVYAIPTLGTPMLINKIGVGLGKILKPRAP